MQNSKRMEVLKENYSQEGIKKLLEVRQSRILKQ